MHPTTRRLARLTIYGGSALAVAALAFACSLQSDTTTPKAVPLRVTDNQTFRDFQVEKTAQLLPDNTGPRYPEQLRAANIDGKVVTQFVVDTTGLPIISTFRVREVSDERFIPSVREAVPNLRFTPADVGGKKVKQLVEMPFTFTATRDANDSSMAVVKFSAEQVNPTRAPTSRQRAPQMTLPTEVYLEYQVEVPVTPAPGNSAPRYPTDLRTANIEGEVLAQFIVDQNGHADSSSLQVVRATNEGFANAVRGAITTFRFSPALVGGKPVKQIVQMPFKFSLSK